VTLTRPTLRCGAGSRRGRQVCPAGGCVDAAGALVGGRGDLGGVGAGAGEGVVEVGVGVVVVEDRLAEVAVGVA
jgi:hypothetical protein